MRIIAVFILFLVLIFLLIMGVAINYNSSVADKINARASAELAAADAYSIRKSADATAYAIMAEVHNRGMVATGAAFSFLAGGVAIMMAALTPYAVLGGSIIFGLIIIAIAKRKEVITREVIYLNAPNRWQKRMLIERYGLEGHEGTLNGRELSVVDAVDIYHTLDH